MKIEVKLYSYHDMDLVSLYKTGQVSFPETTRQILNSYANKEAYKVRLLETNIKRLSRYPSDSYRKYYHYHVVLDDKDDRDAVRLLKHITPGYRNNFIKAILRQYLCGAFIADYSIDGDTKFFDEMSRRFQGDREERDVKVEKRKKRKAKKEQLIEKKYDKKKDLKKTTNEKIRRDITKKQALTAASESLIKKNNENRTTEQMNEFNANLNIDQTSKPRHDNGSALPEKKSSHKTQKNIRRQEAIEEKKESDYQENYLETKIPELTEEQDKAESDYDEDFDDDFDDFLGGTTEQY